MKILHVNSYYVTNDMYTQMYDRQVNMGVEIVAYLPAPRGTNITRPPYSIISITNGKYDRLLFHLKHWKIWADAKKRFAGKHYDLVHAHSLFSNGYIAMRLKKTYGFPYIVAVRTTDLNTFFKYMPHLRGMGRRILAQAERIVFISEMSRQDLLTKYIPDRMKEEIEKKSVVISNGIDDFWRANMFEGTRKAPEKKLRIITVASIYNIKNQITVCKAAEKLIAQGYDVEYTVVGKVYSKRLYKIITAHPFVKYYAHKTKEELKELYQEVDIFVMVSHMETFGLVYAEAMTQGIPVIYTKGQGFDGRFAEGEAGYGVAATDVDGLVDAILKIRDNYEAMSKRCPTLASSFIWDVFVKQYEELMNECLKEKKIKA